MPQDQITLLSNLAGAAIYLVLAVLFGYLRLRCKLPSSMAVAALVSALWQLAIATDNRWYTLSISSVLIAEIARYSAWIVATTLCLTFITERRPPKGYRLTLHGLWIAALAGAIALKLSNQPLAEDSSLIIWIGLGLAIAALVCVEQLYRNTRQLRLIKLICVALAALFSYDIYLFSNGFIFDRLDPTCDVGMVALQR